MLPPATVACFAAALCAYAGLLGLPAHIDADGAAGVSTRAAVVGAGMRLGLCCWFGMTPADCAALPVVGRRGVVASTVHCAAAAAPRPAADCGRRLLHGSWASVAVGCDGCGEGVPRAASSAPVSSPGLRCASASKCTPAARLARSDAACAVHGRVEGCACCARCTDVPIEVYWDRPLPACTSLRHASCNVVFMRTGLKGAAVCTGALAYPRHAASATGQIAGRSMAGAACLGRAWLPVGCRKPSSCWRGTRGRRLQMVQGDTVRRPLTCITTPTVMRTMCSAVQACCHGCRAWTQFDTAQASGKSCTRAWL